MKVGDFGLGGTSPPVIADWDLPRPSGMYQDVSLSTPGQPVNRRFTSITIARSSTTFSDLAIALDSGFNDPRVFARAVSSSGVGNWAEMYHTRNILGTVSQASGVPTGAIIERGSNANGEFVKFADGTLICTTTVVFSYNTTNFQEFSTSAEAAPGSELHHAISFTSNDFTRYSRWAYVSVSRRGSAPRSGFRLVFRTEGSTITQGDVTEEIRVTSIGRWY